MLFFMEQALSYLEVITRSGIDLVLPPRCAVTGEVVDEQGKLSPSGWAGLNFISDPSCNICGIPFDFEQGNICMSCLNAPPVFTSARAAVIYDDDSRNLVLGFKHGDKTHMVPSFMPWMMRAGRDMLMCADILVPVPLHGMRLFLRRYNQAALIAQGLSRETGIMCGALALRRERATPVQGHLNAPDRFENVRGAFAVSPSYANNLRGKIVVLVDDVFTTGATVSECTKTLLEAGVKGVHILTLARVKPHT